LTLLEKVPRTQNSEKKFQESGLFSRANLERKKERNKESGERLRHGEFSDMQWMAGTEREGAW